MILVTGANGFVGSALVNNLAKNKTNVKIISVVRKNTKSWPDLVKVITIKDYNDQSRWKEALHNVSVVIHCAARVHVLNDALSDEERLDAYRKINVSNTLNIAKQAVLSGVRRFIFVSSIKVNGELTKNGEQFKFDDIPNPVDFYGLSKMEAEIGLRQISEKTGLEVVIIRPPLVYGPNVKGNFSTMKQWVSYGIPLPFGNIQNTRSLVALDNLIHLLELCVVHPSAANRTFLVSDCDNVSTTVLLLRLSKSMGKKLLLLRIPVFWLILGAKLIGKKEISNRLFESLEIDVSETQRVLGWQPVISMEKALEQMAQDL
tara:strand:- start:13339 stop:14289 length:951 start_codon:yes stop_codon:yes gene_type:complete